MTIPPVIGSVPIGTASYAPAVASGAATEAFLMLSPSDSDLATLAAGSQVGTLPVTNLQSRDPSKKWRSNNTLSESITVTFAQAVPANVLAVVGHNLSDMGLIRVRGAALAANLTSAPDIDTGAVSAWPWTGKPSVPSWPQFTSIVRWSSTVSARYWQIDFADSSALNTYLEAGRLVLGQAWQPSINFDIGGTPLGFDASDVQVKTRYGRIYTDQSNFSAPRLFEINCYAMTRREAMDGIFEIQRLRGMWGDLICCLNPGESTDFHRFVMQGIFSASAAYTLPPAFDDSGNMFGVGVKLRELI